jgi:hypothetical protein
VVVKYPVPEEEIQICLERFEPEFLLPFDSESHSESLLYSEFFPESSFLGFTFSCLSASNTYSSTTNPSNIYDQVP